MITTWKQEQKRQQYYTLTIMSCINMVKVSGCISILGAFVKWLCKYRNVPAASSKLFIADSIPDSLVLS